MTTSDKPRKPLQSLGAHIDELEALLAEPATSGASVVPVLDELIDAEDAVPAAARTVTPSLPSETEALADFARRLEARLDAELEDLPGVISRIVIRCMHEELSRSSQAEPPGTDAAPPRSQQPTPKPD